MRGRVIYVYTYKLFLATFGTWIIRKRNEKNKNKNDFKIKGEKKIKLYILLNMHNVKMHVRIFNKFDC